MRKYEYPYPNGKVLTPELTQRVNNVVGYQSDNLPFAALYINPHDAFLLPRGYPEELKDLFSGYTLLERREVRKTFGALIKFLYNEGLKRRELGIEIDREELYPSLGYIRGLTPVGLYDVRGLGRIGRLFVCGAVSSRYIDL